MADENATSRPTASGKNSKGLVLSPVNVARDAVMRVKLIASLMADPRVSVWTKLIPIGALAYLISPVDLIMGIPGLSALDDLAVLSAAAHFFIEFSPTDVVKEYVGKLTYNHEHMNDIPEGRNTRPKDEDVIDGEATDVN